MRPEEHQGHLLKNNSRTTKHKMTDQDGEALIILDYDAALMIKKRNNYNVATAILKVQWHNLV